MKADTLFSETSSETKDHWVHQDEEFHWVADLECGHTQHVRHDPPITSRPWVTTPEGRRNRIGAELECRNRNEWSGSMGLAHL